MNEQTFAEKVQNKLPAGTVLDNPGGGQMAILSYNGTKMVYQRGNSPITADLHDLWNAYYYFDQRKPCDVDSAALRQRYPLVFDPHQNGHAANCTMLFVLLREIGVVSAVKGTGKAGDPFHISLEQH